MFVSDAKTRRLLSRFAVKGLTPEEYDTLSQTLLKNLPCVATVVKASTQSTADDSVVRCKSEWSTIVSALGTSSPVCAMLHPSDRMTRIISKMSESDVTTDPANLKVLQEEIPVIFELLRSLGYFPKEILCPLLMELCRVALATFTSCDAEREEPPIQSSSDLACFPVLPRLRSRGAYQADKKAGGPICTKRSSKHPSLLPGIFTIFCQHG